VDPGDDFAEVELRKCGERRALARMGLSGEVETSTERCGRRSFPLSSLCRDNERRPAERGGSRRDAADAGRGGGGPRADADEPPMRVAACGDVPLREGAKAMCAANLQRQRSKSMDTKTFVPLSLGEFAGDFSMTMRAWSMRRLAVLAAALAVLAPPG